MSYTKDDYINWFTLIQHKAVEGTKLTAIFDLDRTLFFNSEENDLKPTKFSMLKSFVQPEGCLQNIYFDLNAIRQMRYIFNNGHHIKIITTGAYTFKNIQGLLAEFNVWIEKSDYFNRQDIINKVKRIDKALFIDQNFLPSNKVMLFDDNVINKPQVCLFTEIIENEPFPELDKNANDACIQEVSEKKWAGVFSNLDEIDNPRLLEYLLHEAIFQHDLTSVKKLLAKNIRVDIVKNDKTPIQLAADLGYWDCVEAIATAVKIEAINLLEKEQNKKRVGIVEASEFERIKMSRPFLQELSTISERLKVGKEMIQLEQNLAYQIDVFASKIVQKKACTNTPVFFKKIVEGFNGLAKNEARKCVLTTALQLIRDQLRTGEPATQEAKNLFYKTLNDNLSYKGDGLKGKRTAELIKKTLELMNQKSIKPREYALEAIRLDSNASKIRCFCPY